MVSWTSQIKTILATPLVYTKIMNSILSYRPGASYARPLINNCVYQNEKTLVALVKISNLNVCDVAMPWLRISQCALFCILLYHRAWCSIIRFIQHRQDTAIQLTLSPLSPTFYMPTHYSRPSNYLGNVNYRYIFVGLIKANGVKSGL